MRINNSEYISPIQNNELINQIIKRNQILEKPIPLDKMGQEYSGKVVRIMILSNVYTLAKIIDVFTIENNHSQETNNQYYFTCEYTALNENGLFAINRTEIPIGNISNSSPSAEEISNFKHYLETNNQKKSTLPSRA